MKHGKKFFVMLMLLCVCVFFAACGSTAGNTGSAPAQAEPAAEDSGDEKTPEAEPGTEEEAEDTTASQAPDSEDTVSTAHVGVIAWSTGMGDELDFIQAVQTILSEQYSDQISDVFVMDAMRDPEFLSMSLANINAMWEGDRIVILIVNDAQGFSDEELLSVLKEAEEAGIIMGVDHAVDGAPANTFVYDASDAAGCAGLTVENVPR